MYALSPVQQIYRQARRTSTKINTVCICSLNAQAVNNKAESIGTVITVNDLNINVIQKTWLRDNSQVVKADLVPEGYQIISIPRITDRGLGVAVNHKSGIKVV